MNFDKAEQVEAICYQFRLGDWPRSKNRALITSIPNYARIFSPLTCNFMMHDNRGKDIGAFQEAAHKIPCDLMVFLGAPIHARQAGWLDRIVNVYEQNGPGLYGPWGFHQPMVHLRTTAFWCAPELLNSYPFVVHNDSRYEFEHGQRSIVNHVTSLGLPVYQVTWDGCYPLEHWHHVPNEQCLLLDQFCDRIGYK
jgi:hypothetical protein